MKKQVTNQITTKGVFIFLPGVVEWSWFNALHIVGVRSKWNENKDKVDDQSIVTLTSGAATVIMMDSEELIEHLGKLTDRIYFEESYD
jgi:hypothetical protein